MSYGNNYNRGGQQRSQYLNSSSLTKTLHFNNEPEVDPQTGQVVLDRNGQPKPRKEKVELSEEVTEEFSITLTAQKVQDLMNRLAAAQQDQSGTGGVRISMYARKSTNKQTNEIFDGMRILVYAQKPPQNQQNGSFQGRGNFQGGGRRSYPPRQAQGYGQPNQGGYPQQGGYPAPGQAQAAPPQYPQQGGYPPPNAAPQAMPQRGPVNPGPQTQGYPQGGPGPSAGSAYPSDEAIPF